MHKYEIFSIGEESLTKGLKFYLLGPPYVTWNDSVLDISRRQVRGLLYYLATYPNAIPKERLHYLLWNDKPEAVCKRNLSHLLTHLRRVLPDDKILIVKKSLIMLDHERIWCDAVEFKSLVRISGENERYQAFLRANELYRGPFLDGKQMPGGREFEYLIERERFYLERNHLNILYKLILIEKRNENFEAAIEYAYQYLAIDDLSEEVHRQLITLYGLSGKRERALAQYKTFEDLLWRELQTKPSQKTQAAYQDALLEYPLEKTDTEKETIAEIRPVKDSPTFISKDNLAQLNHCIHNSGHGPWGIALIWGELGIGKTSLFTKYLADQKQKYIILRTKCNPGTRSIRYWPVREICKAASKLDHRMINDKSNIWVELCNRFIFPANSLVPNSANSFDHFTKEYNFTSFTEFIFGLADAAEGLIICIDDLEWADEDTLDLILYVSRHLKEKRILILGSYCCEENEYLKKFIHNVQLSDDFLGNIKMRRIDLDTTFMIIKYWLGDFEDSHTLAEKLHRISGENPFFLSELLRWIVESNLPVSDLLQNNNISLPTSISKAIGFRLNLLSDVEMKVLEVAAIIGFSFDFDQISELTDIPNMQIFDALDELVIRHLLVNKSSAYEFRHELIYHSVLEKISPARRKFFEKSLSNACFK